MTDLSLQILECGQVGVDEAVPNRSVSKNPLAFVGICRSKKKHHIVIPVKCFLITHPSGAKILVDTGWDSRVREHPIKTITYPMWVASKPILPLGEAVDEQLQARLIQPSDLSYVILTHMIGEMSQLFFEGKGFAVFVVFSFSLGNEDVVEEIVGDAI